MPVTPLCTTEATSPKAAAPRRHHYVHLLFEMSVTLLWVGSPSLFTGEAIHGRLVRAAR